METAFKIEWLHDGHTVLPDKAEAAVPSGVRTSVAPGPASDALRLELTIPLDDINGIWTPYGDRATLQRLIWKGEELATPVFKPGLFAFVDRDLHSRVAFLLEPAEGEAKVAWQIDQTAGAYRVSIAWAAGAAPYTPSMRYCLDRLPVQVAAERLLGSARVDMPGPEAPVPSYEPSCCTWYAFHCALEQKPVEAFARLAAELGFGTFILDDGWMHDDPQRVQGPIGAWFRLHGDYEPSRCKFPDFKAHIETVRAMGLRFLLWAAPFTVGVESRARRTLDAHLLSSFLDEGFLLADPRSSEVMAHLEETFVRLVRDYPLDGFKVDYDYALIGPGLKPYGLGRAYREAVRRLITAVRRVNPKIEWNLLPNTCTRELTDAFRCCDVPFDPETNRLWMANLKTLAGRRPLHFDPALWRPDAPLATVHRHLAPSLFCVPSVGADLLALPAAHREAIRDWLGFYRRHQAVLNGGDFMPVWAAGDYQRFQTTRGHKRVAVTFSAFPVKAGDVPETWLINAGDAAEVNLMAEAGMAVSVENARGEPTAPERGLNRGLHSLACEPGSVLHIRV